MVTQERPQLMPTGSSEIDQLLGGGVPLGALVLVEGESETGKSVLARHLTYHALTGGMSVAYYTTENSIKDLMAETCLLELDVTDYFLCDRLRVYPLNPLPASPLPEGRSRGSGSICKRLLEHFESLPADYRMTVIDSLSGLMLQCDERQIVDFFAACKGLSDLRRTIVATIQTGAREGDLLDRIRSICDTHLALRIEQGGGRPVRVLEVTKVGNVEPPAGNLLGYSIEPGAGIKAFALARSNA